MTSGLSVAPVEPVAPRKAVPHSRPPFSCPECGHVLHVSGLGRHRVYFELGDERTDHPVMNRHCPDCGRCLPGQYAERPR